MQFPGKLTEWLETSSSSDNEHHQTQRNTEALSHRRHHFYLRVAQANSNQSCRGAARLSGHAASLPLIIITATRSEKGAIISNLMAESYNALQGKGNAQGLSNSRLTGIIHKLLTDTHLEERRRRQKGEKTLNNGSQLQYWQENHKAEITGR